MSGNAGTVSGCPPAVARTAQSALPSPGGPPAWPLLSNLELGALASAVPCARLHTTHILREWNLEHLADNAELIVSELATNALKASWSLHGTPPITLRLRADRESLIIAVADALPAPPQPQPHEIDADSGRGLEIVAVLSESWGYYHPESGGKVVWALLTSPVPP
jgi:anti-sigma regulatory factor (Ser/Thr protein kinase)